MKTTAKKTTGFLLLSFILVFLFSVQSEACEMKFEVSGTKKELYKTGDEVIIKATVTFSHRVCQTAIQETKFNTDGLKILSATDWKEITPGTWERKLKIKVTGNKTGKLTLEAVRTCNKQGGFGSITLKGVPTKK